MVHTKIKINPLVRILSDLSLEIFSHLGGLNFDEKDFQLALGYELQKKGIEYLRETHIELYYKDIPVKLGAPDFFLSSEKPPTIIEVKLGAGIANANRQQLRMYLLSIQKNPKSVLKKVKNGILINFLKEDPTTFEEVGTVRKKELFKVEVERFTIDKDGKLQRLDVLKSGKV